MKKNELVNKTNLELIRFIKNKTDKLCWEGLDIATDILEERFEKIENN